MSSAATVSDGVRAPGAPIRVFILDDHELVRRGLRDMLEGEGLQVLGYSGLAQEAVKRIPALHPDVAILDARLPDGNGIEVCREVRSIDPSLKCIILTSYDDDQAERGAVLAGAAGYVLKAIRSTDLLDKIRRVAAGESLFDPKDKERIINGLTDANLIDSRFAELTLQERKVLSLIGEGLSNREISISMSLADNTVKNYVSSMLSKMGFQGRTQAAVFVARGWVARRRRR